jgi:hypothetical protein
MNYLTKYLRSGTITLFIVSMVLYLVPKVVFAFDYPRPETYVPTFEELRKHKATYDDPRPVLKEFGPKQVLPPEFYKMLCYDVEKMKAAWSELVGFKAPDLVGKIAPEIKPGKYTYKDLEKYPGLKQLMWDDMISRIKPGEPPFAGNIPEFEIIPTQQLYWGLPISEMTKANLGKTQLREDGYLKAETWLGGYPFPQPSGKNKAWQIMYNLEKRYQSWGLDFVILGFNHGYTKAMQKDFDCDYIVRHHRLAGRCLMEPYGFFDKRAKERGEFRAFIMPFLSPRDIAGMVQSALYFLDPEKADQLYIYIPSMRRVRKLTATDTQDPIAGQDVTYDDNEGFMQKLSPVRYPYKAQVLDEREYLYPICTEDGSIYIKKQGATLQNLQFQRRPMYVVELTQLDPNYQYSKRIFYIDKETFQHLEVLNYDQKGRLYRTNFLVYSWHPEMGTLAWTGFDVLRDHIDTHSGVQHNYQLPAYFNREDVSMGSVVSEAK